MLFLAYTRVAFKIGSFVSKVFKNLSQETFSKEYVSRSRYALKSRFANRIFLSLFLSLSQDTGLRERHLVKGDPITSTNHQLHEFSEHIREELAISSGSYEYLCTCATIPHDLQQFSPLHQFRGLRQYPKRGM